ncbi:YbaB/EbfC family nucleoid-associated protein [Mycobacterium sp. DL440]|uniref:YbaB/EbfC family nucleoid-associated protein n=1 Tax=Mycobacterium sp. DL440 TaxID=2675523 RepID=UPI00141DD371|nr:YbaB/EbfC family nucleoid-associated protein [Mycobacterium sp. DL440]
MDHDAARHELIDALALVQEQLADLAAVETARAELYSTARTADGTVAVTVDADGVVIGTAVDESYFAEHDLADLGSYITAAAQDAARDVERKVSELFAPLAQRRAEMPALSDIVEGAPDIRVLLSSRVTAPHGDGEEAPDDFPTVRSAR